ncbi:MAG: efflux RND transporter periplasmic adaptor subunit [Bdellovibrionota bacterium]
MADSRTAVLGVELSLVFASLVRMPEIHTSTPRKKFRPYRFISEQEAKSIRRRRRMIMALVAGVLFLAAAAYGYLRYSSFFEKTASARLATRAISLTAKVNGKVQKVWVKETDEVKAGEPLVQIDPGEFQAELEQRQQELKKREDQLAGGKVHLSRLEEKAGSSDEARKQYEDARSWYLRQQTKTQELRAGVAEAKEELDATLIKAPADGHIAKTKVDVGSPVSTEQPLLEFVGVGLPWLIADFREVQLEKMKVGQRAEITVDGINKTFNGKVESLPEVQASQTPQSKIGKLVARYWGDGARKSVRISFDAKSVENDINRMVNGASAEAKVYIK